VTYETIVHQNVLRSLTTLMLLLCIMSSVWQRHALKGKCEPAFSGDEDNRPFFWLGDTA